MIGRAGNAALGWLDLKASASMTRKFVFDAEAGRLRPVSPRARRWRGRSLRWAVLALALAASAVAFSATRVGAQEPPAPTAP